MPHSSTFVPRTYWAVPRDMPDLSPVAGHSFAVRLTLFGHGTTWGIEPKRLASECLGGGPSGAASGKMAIWVGGDEQIFNRHKTVLDAIGDQATYIGPIGTGSIGCRCGSPTWPMRN
jgi:hypothetical protein